MHKKVEIVRGEDLKNRNESTNKLLIKLEETNTIWLLTLDTLYSSEDVADIERVCKQNAAYEMVKAISDLHKICHVWLQI